MLNNIILFFFIHMEIYFYPLSACYRMTVALRNDGWFWFLPLADQYKIASGKVEIVTEKDL